MPLVPAKCTSCGAILEIDSSKDAAICKFCGTPFVTEKAINNYTISGSVVNIYQEAEKKKDFEIVCGTLVKYNGESANVVLPDEVVEIGVGCFRGTFIESITFNENLMSIDNYAFSECLNLKTVKLPQSLKSLGIGVFSGCLNLTEAYYPATIISDKGSTFEYSQSLKKIVLEEGVKTIPIDFARGCEGLEEINIPTSVETIENRAFYLCRSLKSITIPNTIGTIEREAFAKCSSLNVVMIDTRIPRAVAQDAFVDTPWQRRMWSSAGRCPECGGKLFFGNCLNCFNATI